MCSALKLVHKMNQTAIKLNFSKIDGHNLFIYFLGMPNLNMFVEQRLIAKLHKCKNFSG